MSFSEWKVVKIQDICSIRRGASPRPIQEYIRNAGIPWVKIADATSSQSRFVEQTREFIKEEGKSKSRYIEEGTLILSNSATPGIPKMMKINACVHDGWLIIDDYECVIKEYMYYMFLAERERLLRLSNGSVFNNLKTDIVKNYEISLPPLPEQKAIVSILSSLDEKIELNNQMNKTLEEMAQALFKRWFVDFEFPNEEGEPYKSSGGEMVESELGMIPKGWEVGVLEELVSVKYGKDHKKLLDGQIPVYGSGGVMRYVDTILYDKESVLIPRKGTLNNVMYVDTPFWSVDTMFFTEMKRKNLAKFIFFFMKSKDLVSMNAGSAVPSMTTNILNNLKIVIPNDEILKQYECVVSSLFNQMSAIKSENTSLAAIRNTLLPKLMSGEIRAVN